MNIDLATTRLLRNLLIGGTIILAMYVAADVLKPVALAILLTFLLAPIVVRLERLGLPRVVSVGVVFVGMLVVAGGTGYVVGNQFASLAKDLPRYTENIRGKVARLKPSQASTSDKVMDALNRLGEKEAEPGELEPMPVRVVAKEPIWGEIHAYLGPFESILAMGGVVLLLVVFLLFEREAVGDKIIQLVGWGQIGVTTKTLSQIGAGLSSYLTTLALVNAGFGAAIGLGVWAIGLPSPALWGFLAAIFRFVPYLGTVLSFALPFLISIAVFPGWSQPALVLALFAGAEVVVNSVEPLLYGKSTGISPIGLLVSALFWAWLWGPLGLLLANAMTVCLAVSGRSIPGLNALGILLSHDVQIGDDIRWYQRVLSHDQDGALALLDDALKTRTLEEACDQIVIPTLSRAEQDRAQGNVENRDVAFIWRTVREWLDDLAERDDVKLTKDATRGPACVADAASAPARPVDPEAASIVGIATGGGADALVLRMLNMLLRPSGVRLAVVSAGGTSLNLIDRLGEEEPSLILISHLPPVGLTRARYLTKRLRARYSQIPGVFAYWEAHAETPKVVELLKPASVGRVVVSLASARALILDHVQKGPTEVSPAAAPASVSGAGLVDSARA